MKSVMLKDSNIDPVNFERMERKWSFDQKQIDLTRLIIAIYKSPFNFSELYTPRLVNSLYFDDKNFSSINDNLDGINYKKKIRLRWYGNPNIIDTAALEIKEKKGFICKKTVKKIILKKKVKFDFDGVFYLKDLVSKITNYKENLIPVLSTHYKRNYYLSNNKKVRATLDYNIKSSQIIYKNSYIFKKNYRDFVYELKYDRSDDKYVRENMFKITSRYSKNSKYINSAINKPSYFSL